MEPVRPGRRFDAPYESHGWVGYVHVAVSGGVGGILWSVVERGRGVLPVNNRGGYPTEDELNSIEAGSCITEGRTPRCK